MKCTNSIVTKLPNISQAKNDKLKSRFIIKDAHWRLLGLIGTSKLGSSMQGYSRFVTIVGTTELIADRPKEYRANHLDKLRGVIAWSQSWLMKGVESSR